MNTVRLYWCVGEGEIRCYASAHDKDGRFLDVAISKCPARQAKSLDHLRGIAKSLKGLAVDALRHRGWV